MVFLILKSSNILSLSKVCNDRYQIILTNTKIYITKEKDRVDELDQTSMTMQGKQKETIDCK